MPAADGHVLEDLGGRAEEAAAGHVPVVRRDKQVTGTHQAAATACSSRPAQWTWPLKLMDLDGPVDLDLKLPSPMSKKAYLRGRPANERQRRRQHVDAMPAAKCPCEADHAV